MFHPAFRDGDRNQATGIHNQRMPFHLAPAPHIFQYPHHTKNILYVGDIRYDNGSTVEQRRRHYRKHRVFRPLDANLTLEPV